VHGHSVREARLTVGGRQVRLLRPTVDPAELLDDPQVQRRFDVDEYMPYWADLWPAAICLADHVLARGDTVAGGAALEIGCGLGLVSVAAALAGCRVTATDYDPAAIAFTAVNARLNGAQLQAELRDWRDTSFTEPFDMILAADVLYERRNHQPVAEFINRCLAPGGYALVSDPRRAAATGALDEFTARGLICRPQDLNATGLNGGSLHSVLYELSRS
jgi:predicted nicotinamide N-methyase